jgi:transcriptional regulator with XRE-family HTH domain
MLSEKQIGRRIAAARSYCGMTQRDMGKITNLHASAISRLESGNLTITYHHLATISDVTGCTIQYLVGENDDLKMPDVDVYQAMKKMERLTKDKKHLIIGLIDAVYDARNKFVDIDVNAA